MEGGGDLLFVDRGALLKICCKSARVDNQICVEQKVCVAHAHRLAVRTYEFNSTCNFPCEKNIVVVLPFVCKRSKASDNVERA